MKQIRAMLLTVLVLTAVSSPGVAAAESGADDALVVRYACLVGGREPGSAPIAAGVLSREELSDFLLEWEPEADNREVREVFALNELGELSRQATQLPLEGGVVSGDYAHGDSNFEIDMNIRPARTLEPASEVITISAEIKRDGKLLSGPTIHSGMGERAIITTTNGPEAPFLFLVVEVDRVSPEELRRRGLRHSWRKDYMLVDGEEVTAPVALEKSRPAYPPEAKELKYQGRVVLRMVINEEGKIEDVEVVEGQPHGLTEAAVAAASTWRFEPALHQGKPVAVLYMVTINFRLE
jgi:TonB family protein